MQGRALLIGVATIALVRPATTTAAASIARVPLDITTTSRGAELAAEASQRMRGLGLDTDPAFLRVWDLTGDGDDFLVGQSLPAHLATTTTVDTNGKLTAMLTYEIGAGGNFAAQVKSRRLSLSLRIGRKSAKPASPASRTTGDGSTPATR